MEDEAGSSGTKAQTAERRRRLSKSQRVKLEFGSMFVRGVFCLRVSPDSCPDGTLGEPGGFEPGVKNARA